MKQFFDNARTWIDDEKKYILDREDKVTDQRLFTKRREIIAGILSTPFANTSNLFEKGENYLSFKKDMQYSTNEQTNTIKQILIIIFMN